MIQIIGAIWLCLLLSALLGGLIGWLLRAALVKRELDDQEAGWRKRVDTLYGDLGSTQERLALAADQTRSNEAELETGRLEIAQREARVRALQAAVETYAAEVERKNAEILELAVVLDECRRDLLIRDDRIAALEGSRSRSTGAKSQNQQA